jgi:hypothetical protein
MFSCMLRTTPTILLMHTWVQADNYASRRVAHLRTQIMNQEIKSKLIMHRSDISDLGVSMLAIQELNFGEIASTTAFRK